MPKVSVVMPVYNGEKYLREAIESIINQTFTDWEFIIVNEFGSNQEATDILTEYAAQDLRIRVIQNSERLGIAESLNVGLRASVGEYIARMDGDDISGPERLQKQVEYLDRHPDIGLLGIHPTIFGEEHWDWYTEYDPMQIAASSLFFLPCLHPTVMFRKSVLEQYGLFYNPKYHCAEDYDLFERILQHTKASNLKDQELFRYRRYPTAATYIHAEDGNEIYLEVMDRALRQMSLSFSAEELSLLFIHEGCRKISKKDLAEAMEKLDLLLKQIFQKNMYECRFNSHALFHCLHKRWIHMWECDIQPKYSWKDVPREIQDVYRRSIFAQKTFCACFEVEEDHVPKVTVLMPSYNGERYIYEAIKSLENQILQDWELLIINDPSDDNTVSIIQEYQKYDKRIRLIENKTKAGLAKALNQGIKEAKGKYIARIDDDDIAMPDRLERQARLLDERADISLVGSWQRYFGKTEWTHQPPESPEEMKAGLLFNCNVCHSTVMFRKKDFIERGLYYSSEYASEDYELWTRAIRELKFYTIQDVLGEYRVNGENITNSKLSQLEHQQQRIIAQTLKGLLHINVPQSDMILLSGWKNPFFDGGSDQKWLREREEELLQKIESQNEKYHVYDPAALNTTLNQRRQWAGIIKPTRQSKANVPKRTVKQRIKGFIKRLLKPLYHPFRWRYEDRLFRIENSVSQLTESVKYLQKTLYDLDGHLYDYYNFLTQNIQEQDTQVKLLQAELSALQVAVIAGADASIREVERTLIASMDERALQAERALMASIDARIWKAEQAITASTDARIWKAEQTLTESTDARLWKAEQALTASTDARIWQVELNLRKGAQDIFLKLVPKYRLDRLTIHLTEHCNLNCQCCDNFSPIADESYTSIEKLEKDYVQLEKIGGYNIGKIELSGGEALLHPQVCDFIALTRKYFQDTKIELVTNGILLVDMSNEFWKTCAQYNVEIVITKYPIKLNVPFIEKKSQEFGVLWRWYEDIELKTSFFAPFSITGGGCAVRNFVNCFHANSCVYLRDGRIYTCSIAANVHHFNKYFGEHLPDTQENSISIYRVSNMKEILEFISRPIPLCQYCNVDGRQFNLPWGISEQKKREWVSNVENEEDKLELLEK